MPTDTKPPSQDSIQAVVPPSEVREQDKIMLVLAYLGVLALIPLLTVKDSDYVKWHAKNGLVLGLGGGLAISIIAMIPVVNLVTCLLSPALLVVDILAMVKALGGQRWRIPAVSDIAEKF